MDYRRPLKWIAACLFLAGPVMAAGLCQNGLNGESTSSVFNFSTGRQDCITQVSSTTIPAGSTNYIQNTSTPQSGSTFYVSSGTVAGQLVVGSTIVVTGSGAGAYIPTEGTCTAGTSGTDKLCADSTNHLEVSNNGGPLGQVVSSSASVTNTHCVMFSAQGSIVDAGAVCGTGGGTPGGSDQQLQYNNSSSFGGAAGTSITASSVTIAMPGGVLISSGILPTTSVSTGPFNVWSTADPQVFINANSSEANESNMASFRWTTAITGATTQAVPLYCKMINTSTANLPLADGVCMYAWERDQAGGQINLQGAEARVTGQGSAVLYLGQKSLAQWISPSANLDNTGTTSEVVAHEFRVEIASHNATTGLSTGTAISILIDDKIGSGAANKTWTVFGSDKDPSWWKGAHELGTGQTPLPAMFTVAQTSVATTSGFVVVFGTAGFNSSITAPQYMFTVSTTGVVAVQNTLTISSNTLMSGATFYQGAASAISNLVVNSSATLADGATFYVNKTNNIYLANTVRSATGLNYLYLNVPGFGYTPSIVVSNNGQISDTWDTSASSGAMFSTTLGQNYTLAQSTSGTAGQIFYANLNGNYGWAFHAEMPNTSSNDSGYICSDHGANDACFRADIDDTGNTSKGIQFYQNGTTGNTSQHLIELNAAADWHDQGVAPLGVFTGYYEYYTSSGVNTAPLHTLDYLGRQVILVSTGGISMPAGSQTFADKVTMNVAVTSNTVFAANESVCQNNDTTPNWPGETGHIPCGVGLTGDTTSSYNPMIGYEGRNNNHGQATEYDGLMGYSTWSQLGGQGSTSTLVGLRIRTDMTKDGTIPISSGGVVGIYITAPVGQGASGQTFAMINASTYPIATAGGISIGPVTNSGFGNYISFPATPNPPLQVNSQGLATPGEFFESGNSANYEWFELGRTGDDADIVIPAATNSFMTGTNAGDIGIRETTAVNKVVIGAGSGQATLYVNQSSMTVNGSASIPTLTSSSTFTNAVQASSAAVLSETTSMAAASSLDIFWGDSTSHWPKFNANGGPNYQIVGSSASVTNTHCAMFSAQGSVVDSGGNCGGGTGSPGGTDQQLQYNNATAFGGAAGTSITASSMTLNEPVLISTAVVSKSLYLTNINVVSAANYVATSTDTVILSSCTATLYPGGICTITLPTISAANKGQMLVISKADTSSGTVVINTGSANDVIDGTQTVRLNAQNQTVQMMATTNNLWIPWGQGVQITPPYIGYMNDGGNGILMAASSNTVICPFYSPVPVEVVGYRFWTVSGGANANFGIYDKNGTLFTSTGPVTISGGGAKSIATNPVVLPAGLYFEAAQFNDTSISVAGINSNGGNGSFLCSQKTGVGPLTLPATFTFGTAASSGGYALAISVAGGGTGP